MYAQIEEIKVLFCLDHKITEWFVLEVVCVSSNLPAMGRDTSLLKAWFNLVLWLELDLWKRAVRLFHKDFSFKIQFCPPENTKAFL